MSHTDASRPGPAQPHAGDASAPSPVSAAGSLAVSSAAVEDAAARGLAVELVSRDGGTDFGDLAAAQGLTEDDGVKTLVVKISGGTPVFVLIPGTRRLDWAKLRALLAVNKASLVTPEAALELTGYQPGTITPLGSRTALPVYADERIGGRVGMGSGALDMLLFTDADALLASLGAVVGDVTSAVTR